MQDKRKQETTLASQTGIPVVPAIELRALCKAFGTLQAVDQLTLTVEQGKTVLITTNYLEEAQALCERIAILDHGKLIAVDTPEHLKQTYGGSIVELETMQRIDVADDLRALPGVKEVRADGTRFSVTTQGSGEVVPQIINLVTKVGELRTIAVREPTLDEVFLQLTGTALRD